MIKFQKGAWVRVVCGPMRGRTGMVIDVGANPNSKVMVQINDDSKEVSSAFSESELAGETLKPMQVVPVLKPSQVETWKRKRTTERGEEAIGILKAAVDAMTKGRDHLSVLQEAVKIAEGSYYLAPRRVYRTSDDFVLSFPCEENNPEINCWAIYERRLDERTSLVSQYPTREQALEVLESLDPVEYAQELQENNKV